MCAEDVNPAEAGGDKELTIGIAKGQNFDEDVTLKFTGLPKGVTFDPAKPRHQTWGQGNKTHAQGGGRRPAG